MWRRLTHIAERDARQEHPRLVVLDDDETVELLETGDDDPYRVIALETRYTYTYRHRRSLSEPKRKRRSEGWNERTKDCWVRVYE